MLKKILLDALGFFGIYTLYLNVLNFLMAREFKLIIDSDLLPFFLILAIYLRKREAST